MTATRSSNAVPWATKLPPARKKTIVCRCLRALQPRAAVWACPVCLGRHGGDSIAPRRTTWRRRGFECRRIAASIGITGAMSEKKGEKEPIKVTDRRAFTLDGERRSEAPETPEREPSHTDTVQGEGFQIKQG